VSNVRPISISDVFHTIMEKWILMRIQEVYVHSPKQFGFRKGYSCQHAIITVLETIKFSKKKKKRLFLCLIDASKAFDKINRYKLWVILKNICKPAIIRYLIKYYSNSYAFVKIDKKESDYFKTELGVKQGGCLSPLLFAIYVADLEEIINKMNVGVKIGQLKVNLIMYADDIALLCETRSDMEKLLSAVDKYGKEKEIKFNGNKTNLLVFNKKIRKLNKKELEEEKISLKLDDELIVEVDEARYLGFILNTNKLNYAHIENRLSTFATKVFQLNRCDFDKPEMPSRSKSIIYKAHLRPILFYGIDCINLNNGDIKKLYATEGNTIKLSHDLYTGIHSSELFLALGMDITENLLKLNRIKLFIRLVSCNYTCELLLALIDESINYSIKNTIISDVMAILNCQTTDLQTLLDESQAYVSQSIKNFKCFKEEDEMVVNIRHLLDRLPSSKSQIENILRTFDNTYYQDDTSDLNDMFRV
jgi:hypothetical protein